MFQQHNNIKNKTNKGIDLPFGWLNETTSESEEKLWVMEVTEVSSICKENKTKDQEHTDLSQQQD